MGLTQEQFNTFFQELHGYAPFRWQRLLASRVATEGWPEGIDLPPASGKTACLDIAIFTLALSAQRKNSSLRPRRIFFVVDRRIVVDEAAERAHRIATRLREATSGVLKEVADILRQLGRTEEPLLVARMRGGTLRDDRWVENPAQPTIITSTVDQVGSRVLFRGYGPGPLSQSIHAGLVAYDSLIFLDEAHCAVPFMQTVQAVKRYAGTEWMESEVVSQMAWRPLELVVLSATLPPDIPQQKRFPTTNQERQEILGDENLIPRISTSKPAELLAAKKPPKRDEALGESDGENPLVLDLAQRAANLASQGYQRIAVMVNRVATAWYIWRQLQQISAASLAEQLAHSQTPSQPTPPFDLILLTGRMRPLDRDHLLAQWTPVLKAANPQKPHRPIILVTTQCLEVGADFSFDALLTECASFDALRQRFGRLNRLGTFERITAAIVIAKKPKVTSLGPEDRDKLADDPLYGNALEATWVWLNQHASNGQINFSTSSLTQLIHSLSKEEQRLLLEEEKLLLAPTEDAPVMLPAHLDFLCQTAPRPEPDPAVALFLHGPARGLPEARVVFRADLDPQADNDTWLDTAAMLPPIAAEALNVPLPYLRRWLAGEDLQSKPDGDPTGDIDTLRMEEKEASTTPSEHSPKGRRFLLWRGREKSRVSSDPEEIYPEEMVVVPADEQWARKLAHYFNRPSEARLDVAEQARWTTRHQAFLRIHPAVLAPWKPLAPIADLLQWASQEDPEESALPDLLAAIIQYQPTEGEPSLPDWFHQIVEQLLHGSPRLESHPAGGLVIFVDRKTLSEVQRHEFADEDDSTLSAPKTVSLQKHAHQVQQKAREFALACGFTHQLADDIALAALLHDLGKADERFQVFLRGCWPMAILQDELLAKSENIPSSPSVRRQRRQRAELPNHFRHEMLSVQLAEQWEGLPNSPLRRDLILHLIASHHGYARPFAPVCFDDDPPDVTVEINKYLITLSSDQRKDLAPPHRLDSGIPERFWRLTRCYGWWGLAYLEAILRLADWYASVYPQGVSSFTMVDQGATSHG